MFQALLFLVAALPSAGGPVEPLGDAGAGPCWSFTRESRPTGYGYRHIVSIKNGCKKTVACDVSTDVNPEVMNVSVAAGETREVVTFLEAPRAFFTAKVSCK